MHDCLAEHGVVGHGKADADIMFIGIAPGRTEWARKVPMVGASGQLLNGLLKWPANIAREDVFVTNLICWYNDEPSKVEMEACKFRLWREINTVKPKLIVCLGKLVTEFLMPFAGKFGKARGGVWRESIAGHECWVLSTYHPAAYLRKDSIGDIADGVRDFKKLPLILKWQPDHADVIYNVASTIGQVNNVLQQVATLPELAVVAADVETKYDGSAMLSIAFSWGHDDTWHVPTALMHGPNWSLLANTAANVRWTFHNGMFDIGQIKRHLNVALPIVEDTMLQSYSLDERGGGDTETDSGGFERSVGIHGLKRLAREYCAAGYYDSKSIVSNPERQSDAVEVAEGAPIEQLTPAELAEYNSKDAAYTWRLQALFEQWQIDDNVRYMYNDILIPAANALSEMRDYGAYVDRHELRQLALEWIPDWLALNEKLHDDAVTLGWPAEDRDLLNLNTWQHLHKLVYDICKHKILFGQGRTTKRDVLEQFALEGTPLGDWCATLLRWRGRNHDVTTWIVNLEEAIDANGRIHPEPLIHGTRVGRTSYHNPPVGTVPKPRTVGEERARLRRIFKATPNTDEPMVLIEADYSQAELWSAALVSGDINMLDDLREPFYNGDDPDFHRRLANTAFDVDKGDIDETTWDRYRNSAKAFAFGGVLYGGGVDVLTGKHYIGKAQPNLYFIKDLQRATSIIKSFEERYDKFYAWRESEKQLVMREGEQVSFSGRKRRYYQINDYRQLNQVGNFPISCISHEHLFMSMVELHPLLLEYNTHIWWECHDSLLIEAPQRYLDVVVNLIHKVMTRPRFGFETGIPVDFKVGENWFELHKYKPHLEVAA